MRQLALTICAIALLVVPQNAGAPSAEMMLEKVDQILSPSVDFTMRVSVKDTEPGKPAKLTEFKMLAKGREHTLLMTLSPKSSHGRNLLYIGPELWVYLPSVRRPFKISLQERLTGEASNADLARANYSRDYVPALTGTETICGKQYHRLELKQKSPAVPYDTVVMWVGVDDGAPYKAQFYAASGRLLKECLYERFEQFFEMKRPTRLVLHSAVKEGSASTLEYSEWKQEPLPMKFFDKSFIDKTKYSSARPTIVDERDAR